MGLYTGSGSNHPLLQLVCRDVVVTSAEFALRTSLSNLSLCLLHMPLTLVMWSSGGVVVESESCIFVDATGVISFHFLPSGNIVGNGSH